MIKTEKIKPRTRGYAMNPTVKKALIKEIEENLFTRGYNWNKSELARKYKTTAQTIRRLIKEITDMAKHIDYEAMQIYRLEKQRQLLLEELNGLRQKNKPRSHILRELRETEKSISEERRKCGLSENKEKHKIDLSGEVKEEVEYVVKIQREGQDEE